MSDQNNFGIHYESRVVATCLRESHFLHSFVTVFNEEFFIAAIHQMVMKLIKAFYTTYRRAPDQLELEILVKEYLYEEYSPDKAEQEYALFKFESQQYFKYSQTELEFVKDTAMKFIELKALDLAIMECVGLRITPERYKMPSIVRKALAIGRNMDDFGIDYFAERRKRAMLRYNRGKDACRIPFFIPKLDDIIGGVGFRENNFGSPELLLFGGWTNVGKSRCIVHMAKNALSYGHHGIIFSSEMSEDLYADRLDMAMGLFTSKDLYDHNKFSKLQDRLTIYEREKGKLFIKKFPQGTTTIQETLEITEQMQDAYGVRFKWIAWDYTDLFRPDNLKAERRFQIEQMVNDQKRIVDELQIAGIGAFQLNREGSREEMADLDNVAEAVTPARVADIIMILAQTEEEYLKVPPEMRWCARKVRGQEKNQTVRLIDDRHRMLFLQHPEEQCNLVTDYD